MEPIDEEKAVPLCTLFNVQIPTTFSETNNRV